MQSGNTHHRPSIFCLSLDCRTNATSSERAVPDAPAIPGHQACRAALRCTDGRVGHSLRNWRYEIFLILSCRKKRRSLRKIARIGTAIQTPVICK